MDMEAFLPADRFAGALLGRVWAPAGLSGAVAGPAPVWVREDGVFDLSSIAPTCADLMNADFSVQSCDPQDLKRLGAYDEIMAHTVGGARDEAVPRFLAPIDVQAIKACGVTFAVSMIERVIEERAAGDAQKADEVRKLIQSQIGSDLSAIKPGSEQAEALKTVLSKEGLWSQYMEVGIGPFAEVFTKSQPLSAVGPGAEIGILPVSNWNNPEPEIVLIVNAEGRVMGATLGNDVNLRDIEGRSALLLGKAKDNNASCALGPFIRLFDESFNLDDVRKAAVKLEISGAEDGFQLTDASYMSEISRDVLDLVSQTMNENHQYPDGFALFTGTLFAPTQDRGGDGKGFTHEIGDTVRISSEKLGMLQNSVTRTDKAPPWRFGTLALMKNLSARGWL